MAEKKTYAERLRHPRWQRRRLEVMGRDNFRCVECGDEETELHVHHKTYVWGREPWDYPLDNFATLCARCHGLQKQDVKTLQAQLLEELGRLGLPADIGKLTGSLVVRTSKPFAEKLVRFVEMFWVVFDNDWWMTKACLGVREGNGYVADGGSFVHPGVGDESNNWANRGALLAAYRELTEAMGGLGLPSEPPFTAGDPHDDVDILELVTEAELQSRARRIADLEAGGAEWNAEGRFYSRDGKVYDEDGEPL